MKFTTDYQSSSYVVILAGYNWGRVEMTYRPRHIKMPGRSQRTPGRKETQERMNNVVIHPTARIGENNHFGDGVTIGPDVVIGDNNRFSDGVKVVRSVQIGSDNYFGQYVVLGVDPSNSRTRPELNQLPPDGIVTIGNRTVIREFSTVDLPTGDLTSIGSDCYLMQHNAISHDVVIEDRAILSTHCGPGGHSVIMHGANLGKGVQVHQRNVIGPYTMIGVGTVVVKNILPGATVAGTPARFLSTNRVGLERNGFFDGEIAEFEEILNGHVDVTPGFEESSEPVRKVFRRYSEILKSARDERTVPTLRVREPLLA